MGTYASNIPDLEPRVIEIIDQVLFHPSELRDKLLAHIEQGARALGLLPASSPTGGSVPATPVSPGDTPETVAADWQARHDTLSAEQNATLTANTGGATEGQSGAPWRYDPVTGAPIERPDSEQPTTFGGPAAGADQTGGVQSAVASD